MWISIVVPVLWSRDAARRFVEVWLESELVVPRARTATLLDEEFAFFQLGNMRKTSDVSATIIIDHAMEATALAEVTPPPTASHFTFRV